MGWTIQNLFTKIIRQIIKCIQIRDFFWGSSKTYFNTAFLLKIQQHHQLWLQIISNHSFICALQINKQSIIHRASQKSTTVSNSTVKKLYEYLKMSTKHYIYKCCIRGFMCLWRPGASFVSVVWHIWDMLHHGNMRCGNRLCSLQTTMYKTTVILCNKWMANINLLSLCSHLTLPAK